MLARLCSKSFKLSFRSMWTKNFKMYKLGLEKTEKPKIKLATFVGSLRTQGNSRKTSTSALLTKLKLLTVWITTNCRILKEIGISDYLTCLLRNLYAGQEATVRTRHGTMDWFQNGKQVHQGWLSPAYLLLRRVQRARLTSWNQDCQEKYQQRQICRWYHSNGGEWRWTKVPLNEGERGEASEKADLKLNIKKSNIMASSPITSWQIEREWWKQWQILFSWAPKSLRIVTAVMKLKGTCS